MAAPRKALSLTSLLALAASIALVMAVAGLGGSFNAEALQTWYPSLEKSPLTPPNLVFPVVWATLYLMMALAAWRVWLVGPDLKASGGPLALYLVQLALNLLWSYLFFAQAAFALALGELALLFVLIVLTARSFFARDRLAGGLLMPYALWVLFAGYLNLEIVRLNP